MGKLPVFFALLVGCIGQPVFAQESALPGQAVSRRNPYLVLGDTFRFVNNGDPLSDWNPVRQWSSIEGKSMLAKILEVRGNQVAFLLSGGDTTWVSLHRLTEDDRQFIREWLEMSQFFNLEFSDHQSATDTVTAKSADGAFAQNGRVHESKHFRFESDQSLSAATVEDFSRMFEATRSIVLTLPLALAVDRPEREKFKVRLFSDKNQFHLEGGGNQAAGVYILKNREILVPFSSLGLEKVGNHFRKAREYDPSTLIHEITHAVTHQWLDYMPMWLTEGLADYVAAIPYRDGSFHLDELDHGIHRMASINFGGDALRFRILQPDEFVYLGRFAYMQRPEHPEQVIQLSAVEPFQIRLASKAESSRQSKLREDQSVSSLNTFSAEAAGKIKSDPHIVVQRYTSSMLLVHHLISSGQADSLRRYLFGHLHFVWETEKYIADYNRSLEEHQARVNHQISEFDKLLQGFNEQIKSYNELVRRRNAGEKLEMPPVPSKPIIPEPIPVPEILALPRSAESFSQARFRQVSIERHLELPAQLSW